MRLGGHSYNDLQLHVSRVAISIRFTEMCLVLLYDKRFELSFGICTCFSERAVPEIQE